MTMPHSRVLRAGLLALLSACASRPAVPEPRTTPPPRAEEPRPEVREPPLVLGALLPESGAADLRQYGELIRQGIDIALRDHERAGGRPVQLVVLDDAGDASRAAGLVADLEARNAIAVVGPLLGTSLAAAARGRSDSALVLISPTSSERAPRVANVYTLNAPDTRGAEALAVYAGARRLSGIAMLYPRTPEFAGQADAFRRSAAAAGAPVSLDVPFDPGTTTFAQPLRRLRDAAARTVFIPASERDIRQLAPQLEYYGLSGIQVLGSEAWASEEVLGLLPPRLLEGVIAATPLYRSSPSVAWEEFVGRYEAAFRRTLDNPYPALGYDAARLILDQLPSGRARRADVARALDRLAGFRGATGVLSTRDGMITRDPFLVRIQAGRPVLAEAPGR